MQYAPPFVYVEAALFSSEQPKFSVGYSDLNFVARGEVCDTPGGKVAEGTENSRIGSDTSSAITKSQCSAQEAAEVKEMEEGSGHRSSQRRGCPAWISRLKVGP